MEWMNLMLTCREKIQGSLNYYHLLGGIELDAKKYGNLHSLTLNSALLFGLVIFF